MSKKNMDLLERMIKMEGDLNSLSVTVTSCNGALKDQVKTLNDTVISSYKDMTASLVTSNTRITAALIGVIGAMVATLFKPHSPIDWVADADAATRVIAVFVFVFMAVMIWKAYKLGVLTKTNPEYLCLGLMSMSVAMSVFLLAPWLEFGTGLDSFLILAPFRFSYIVLFSWYGWHVIDVNQHDRKTVK